MCITMKLEICFRNGRETLRGKKSPAFSLFLQKIFSKIFLRVFYSLTLYQRAKF